MSRRLTTERPEFVPLSDDPGHSSPYSETSESDSGPSSGDEPASSSEWCLEVSFILLRGLASETGVDRFLFRTELRGETDLVRRRAEQGYWRTFRDCIVTDKGVGEKENEKMGRHSRV